jgi:CRISPR system Cascade subunit CasE
MFLSKLVLNERNRQVQYDLGNAHKLHQQIMHAFPDEADKHGDDWSPRQEWNILFRQEPDSSIILVQSDIEPDWSILPQNYLSDRVPSPVDQKPFNLTIPTLEKLNTFQFRLKANPSKRDNATRKTIGFFKPNDQLAWLQRQADRSGFRLLHANVIPSPNIFAIKEKGTSPIRIATAMFQGVLEVTNPTMFLTAVQQGLGKGKSYGCGLLSIARIKT